METVNDIRKFYSDKERTVIDYTANMNTYSSPTNGVVVNTLNPQLSNNENSEVQINDRKDKYFKFKNQLLNNKRKEINELCAKCDCNGLSIKLPKNRIRRKKCFSLGVLYVTMESATAELLRYFYANVSVSKYNILY